LFAEISQTKVGKLCNSNGVAQIQEWDFEHFIKYDANMFHTGINDYDSFDSLNALTIQIDICI
jgi:hypothetical protein